MSAVPAVGLWRHTLTRCGPGAAAARYVTLARRRAERARAGASTAPPAHEDVARLAAALGAVVDLHAHDGRGRCTLCSAGPLLVRWPCRTRRAIEHGLRHGWPAPDSDQPDPAPGGHESFAVAVLAVHDILPAAGGHPPVCRTCLVPPEHCPVWTLAAAFLGVTPTAQPAKTRQPAGAR